MVFDLYLYDLFMKKILILALILLAVVIIKNNWNEELSLIGGKNGEGQQVSTDSSKLLVETYTDSKNGYSIKLPSGFKTESEGDYSKRFMPDKPVMGVGPVNFLYVSVVTPAMKNSRGEIYNYDPDHFNKMVALKSVGESVSLVDSKTGLKEWYTYTLASVEEINGSKVRNFLNSKPWEFPKGTVENKFVYMTDKNIYILGYYTGGEGVSGELKLDPEIALSIIKSFKTIN